MSAKDKKLLTIAVAVLIVFAVILVGIKPTFTKYQEAKDQKAELKVKKVQMQTEIENLPSYEASHDQSVKAYQAVANRVYGDLNSPGVHDATVNDIVAAAGLTTTSFTITNITPQTLIPYAVKADETGNVAGSGGVETQGAAIRVADITISVSGTTEQIENLLNTMNADEGISVRQTSYTPTPEGTSASISFLMFLSETY